MPERIIISSFNSILFKPSVTIVFTFTLALSIVILAFSNAFFDISVAKQLQFLVLARYISVSAWSAPISITFALFGTISHIAWSRFDIFINLLSNPLVCDFLMDDVVFEAP